jgi:pimeloyl-ACP methyl ester carboxylesterase
MRDYVGTGIAIRRHFSSFCFELVNSHSLSGTVVSTKPEFFMDGVIRINQTSLFYTERHPAADTTIFFFHGNSSSRHTWKKIVENNCLQDYRTVAFDLPAHGESGAMTTPYSLSNIGALMAEAVLKLARGKPLILVGASIGTNIVAEILSHQVQPLGIVLIAPCIVGGHITLDAIAYPGTKVGVCFIDSPEESEIEGMSRQVVNRIDHPMLNEFLHDFKGVKDGFRSGLSRTLTDNEYSDEIELLKKAGIPVSVIAGAAEELIKPDYLDDVGLNLWRNAVCKINNAGHWAHIDAPAYIGSLLNCYIEERLTDTLS